MSLDLFSMSLDLFSMSLDPRVKIFLGDLCFIGPVQHVILPVQHVIGPVQHVIGPRIKTIFGRPLFHWTCPACHFTCPACHFTCPACHWTCSACHWTPVLKLFLGDLCFIGPVQHFSFYLSNMSLDLSSMSLDLSSMSLDLSSMSLDLSSMSFVDDPLSQSSFWGGMKHFLLALKNLLVGNLKNFILLIHDGSQENFEGYFDRDPKHNVGV
ncbi:hypothetical protein TNCV_1526701 [Trichonephila clavipes]|nr:hypothetical protein TNCV_1526701 [Trichonephila clavipes]